MSTSENTPIRTTGMSYMMTGTPETTADKTTRFKTYMKANPITKKQEIGAIMSGIRKHRLPDGTHITRKECKTFYAAAQTCFGKRATAFVKEMPHMAKKHHATPDQINEMADTAIALFRASNITRGHDESVKIKKQTGFMHEVDKAQDKAMQHAAQAINKMHAAFPVQPCTNHFASIIAVSIQAATQASHELQSPEERFMRQNTIGALKAAEQIGIRAGITQNEKPAPVLIHG